MHANAQEEGLSLCSFSRGGKGFLFNPLSLKHVFVIFPFSSYLTGFITIQCIGKQGPMADTDRIKEQNGTIRELREQVRKLNEEVKTMEYVNAQAVLRRWWNTKEKMSDQVALSPHTQMNPAGWL
jgi:hypothetical protein